MSDSRGEYLVVQLDIPDGGVVQDIDITIHGPFKKWTAHEVRASILDRPQVPGRVTMATTKKLPAASVGVGFENKK